MLHCPNCNSPVESQPVRCEVCGYRSDLAREFLWLYLGGGAIMALGLALGSLGVVLEGTGPGHWSHVLRGWFPLAPWSETWLACLVVGILFTVGGLGITRRRVAAWIALAPLALYELVWSLLAATGWVGPDGASGLAAALAGGCALLMIVLCRIGLAYRRTPARDSHQIQLRARQKQNAERE